MYDSYAVKVCVLMDGVKQQIGFLGKDIAAEISPKMRRGENFPVYIVGCGIYYERPYCEIEIDGI